MRWITNRDAALMRTLGPHYVNYRRPAWWRQIVRNLRDLVLGESD